MRYGGFKIKRFFIELFWCWLKYKIKGSIFDILNILFSCFIIALFFRHRVLKFIDLYLSRQACKVNFSFIRVTGKFVSFSLRDSERGGVGGG